MDRFKLFKYRYSILFCIVASVAGVTIDGTLNYMPVNYSLFFTVLLATLYFHIICVKKIIYIYKQVFKNISIFLLLNISVSTMWYCTFMGINLGGATFYRVMYFITLAVSTMIIFDRKNNLFKILSLITCIVITFIFSSESYLALFIGIGGGLSVLSYNSISKVSHEKLRLSASELLAIRYWILLIILFLIIPVKDYYIYTSITNISKIALIVILSMILQLWLSQKGVVESGVKHHGYIMVITPFLTSIAQLLVLGEWNTTAFIVSFVAPLIILFKHAK